MNSTTSGSTRTSGSIDADHSGTGDNSARDHKSAGADTLSGAGIPPHPDSSAGADTSEEREGAKTSHRPAEVKSKDLARGAARHHVRMQTPFGGLYVVVAEGLVVGVYHEDHDPPPGPARLGQPLHAPDGSSECDVPGMAVASASDTAVLKRARQELVEYFDGRRRILSFPRGMRGTAFQENVWRVLAEIPFGARRSYRDVAGSLGNPAMGRAIGAAVRANPLSIVIPGHRVVSSSGKVVGYAAGVDVKSALLDFERSHCAPLERTVADASGPPAAPAASHARGITADMPPISVQE